MLNVFEIQNFIVLAGALVLYVLQGWALGDAAIRKPETFVAAEKLTKTAWVVILAVAFAAHVIFVHPINLLNLAGAVAAIVYLVDVRPAVKSFTRR